MRFSTRMLVLQLACVAGVVAICTGVFVWLGVQQLRAEAESSALSIARTVAADADVRSRVARISADPGTPSADELRDGPLAVLAAETEKGTGALFVVITDDHGIRLAHPDAALLGQVVSTSFADALAGRETVSWASGTLGASARAKVPVRDPESGEPVGEVSVGFAPASVFGELPLLLAGVGLAAAAALLLGTIVSMLLRRRLERLTLGLQPEELAALVQNQAAVLDGVGDGVLGCAPDGTITVANAQAARLLGRADLVGRGLSELGLPSAVMAALTATSDAARSSAAEPVQIGERVVFIDTRPVSREDRDLGTIVVLRDRTDVVNLTDRLESVAATTDALRVQRHEFANRLHVTAGLIDADRTPDARAYLDQVLEASRTEAFVPPNEHFREPFLLSFLESKSVGAAERGVRLTVGADSLVRGVVAEPEDVATVLGNLIDNAVAAAVAGEQPRWVIVELLEDDTTLVLTVSDSGRGVADADALSERLAGDRAVSDEPDDPAAVHGRGIGLPLARRVAQRVGGDVWLADAGGGGSGAVFCARLPNALRPHAAPPEGDGS